MPASDSLPQDGQDDADAVRRKRLWRLVVLCFSGSVLYLAIGAAAEANGLEAPRSLQVAVPFLLVPLAVFLITGEPIGWGKLDRGFALSIATYVPFGVWAAASVAYSPGYFAALPAVVFSASAGALWALDTFFHVGAVDFFTKRVVQHESTALWGERRGQAVQFAAWCGAHVVEWLWLRFVLGDVGAAAFLGIAGAATGYAYSKWKNVIGLMVGHLLVNVIVAVAALLVYG